MTVVARHENVQEQDHIALNAVVDVTTAANAGQQRVTFQRHGHAETIEEG